MENASADKGSARDGEDPGPDDAAGDAPADGGEAARGSDTDDGACDGVGGADRNAKMSRSEQGECASGLRGETPEWHQFGNALAHGFDDAPAASHCAATHRQVAADNHPIGNGVRFHESAGDKSCGDDAHAFLSIIGAMAEAVASRREQLQTAKPFIDFLRALHADDPTGSDGDTHSKK